MKTYKVTVDEYATRWYNEQDQLHRKDGPAVERANGYKEYYINGQLHRPAIEFSDGSKSYFINGKYVSEQNFKNRACHGKIVTIDGKQYKLQALKNRACHGKIVTIDGKQYKLQAL